VPRVTPLEQQVVAAKLDAIHAEAQHLMSIYKRKLTALNELKNALLHMAFSGEM
jgi:type I restriction enzyme S subunit